MEQIALDKLIKNAKDRNILGLNPFSGKRGSSMSTNNNLRRLEDGTHPSQTKIECIHCNKIVDSANSKRHHFDNCKLNPNRINEELMCPNCGKSGDHKK